MLLVLILAQPHGLVEELIVQAFRTHDACHSNGQLGFELGHSVLEAHSLDLGEVVCNHLIVVDSILLDVHHDGDDGVDIGDAEHGEADDGARSALAIPVVAIWRRHLGE